MKLALAAALALCLAPLAFGQQAKDSSWTPRTTLRADFVQNSRCPVFEPGARPALNLKVDGVRTIDDVLQWSLLDWEGKTLATGELPVPKGSDSWEGSLTLPQAPAGSFEVHLKLDKAETTIPRMGTRPEGFVTYAVLPKLEALKLDFVDQSRFGGMGTNFIKSGEFMRGDYLSPVYPLVGMKWCYYSRHLKDLFPNSVSDFKPLLDPAKMAERGNSMCEKAAGLCLLTDLHGLPEWLVAVPNGAKLSKTGEWAQAYAPNDFDAYGKMIGLVASEQALNRKVNFPNQRKNYYFIHWEPDWHWKGSDDDFVKMYETAFKAIHENDPDGLLLGANYGVVAAGNKHFERLFPKGLGKSLDGVITHGYFVPEIQNPEKASLIEDLRKLRALTDKYIKPGAFVIDSEWGTSYGSLPAVKDHSALDGELLRFMRGHLIGLGETCDATTYFYTADMGAGGWGLFYNLTSPHPVFGATHVSPKPRMAAATFAVRLLERTKRLGSLEFLGDGVWGYAFDRDGVVAEAVWSSDDAERELSVPVGVAKLRAFDPMGNESELVAKDGVVKMRCGPIPRYLLGVSKSVVPSGAPLSGLPGDTLDAGSSANFLLLRGSTVLPLGAGPSLQIPKNASAGAFLLVAVDPADGRWLSSSVLTVKPKASLEVAGSTLKISNLCGSTLKGVLSVSKAGALPFFKEELSIPVLETLERPLDASRFGVDSSADQDLIVRFKDSDGATAQVSASLRSSYSARKALRKPELDASLSDWQLELFRTVSGDAPVLIGKGEWTGDSDLSFRYALQYDESSLYVALKVRDQAHVQESDPSKLWENDSVQVAVALHPDGGDWKLFHKFSFGRSSKSGEVFAWRDNGTKELPAGRLSKKDVSCSIARCGDETFYMIAIPWSSLDKSLGSFPQERKIGVGILVNDVDLANGRKTARKAAEAFGGMGYTISKDFGSVGLN